MVKKVSLLSMPSDYFPENQAAATGTWIRAIPLSLMYINVSSDYHYSTTISQTSSFLTDSRNCSGIKLRVTVIKDSSTMVMCSYEVIQSWHRP
jgi:hypothetical protein